jgi:hypothetical protein
MSSLKTEHDVYPPPISSAISPGAQTPHPPLNVFISSSLTQSPLGMGTGMNMLMPPPPPGTPQQHMLQQSPLGFIHPPMPPPLQHHHQMVFSGVTNGEALWSLPPRHNVPGSPENSSDGGSVVGQAQRHGSITSTTPRHTTGPAGAGVAMPGGQQQQQQPGMALIGDLEWVSCFFLSHLVHSISCFALLRINPTLHYPRLPWNRMMFPSPRAHMTFSPAYLPNLVQPLLSPDCAIAPHFHFKDLVTSSPPTSSSGSILEIKQHQLTTPLLHTS